jgi:hypothetical protein
MLMLFATFVIAVGTASGSTGRQEALVVGSWECETNCPDEEVAFTIEDGKHVYRSWLHHRPAVANAEWSLQGSDLTVTHDSGILYEWRVVQVTNTRLVLRDREAPARGKSDDIRMRRISG